MLMYNGADSLLETPHIQARDARKWLPGDGSGFAYRARRVGCTRVETGSRLLKKVARAAVFDTSIDFTPSAKLTPTQVTNTTSDGYCIYRRESGFSEYTISEAKSLALPSEMRFLGICLLAFPIELFRGRAWVVVSENRLCFALLRSAWPEKGPRPHALASDCLT